MRKQLDGQVADLTEKLKETQDRLIALTDDANIQKLVNQRLEPISRQIRAVLLAVGQLHP